MALGITLLHVAHRLDKLLNLFGNFSAGSQKISHISDMDLMLMLADRIFVHAWWRSGSTYIWSKLRKNGSFICYYEPLHEKNSQLTIDAVEGAANPELVRIFRHPTQKESYFAEYAALVRSTNLQFSPALSYDRFLLRPDERDDELRVYIAGLLKAASEARRTAVLCFCRSQMRSGWMKKTFGGVHVAQIRNPYDQWASFHVEPYFRNKMLIIALKLRNLHPRSFAHIEGFERFARSMSKYPAPLIRQLFDRFIDEKDALAIFLVVWTTSALQAISFADFVIDIDRLSTDPSSRRNASRWFETIGCPIDFSDCASPSSNQVLFPENEFERMIDEATEAVRTNAAALAITDADVVRQWLASLSPLSSKVLRLALEEGRSFQGKSTS